MIRNFYLEHRVHWIPEYRWTHIMNVREAIKIKKRLIAMESKNVIKRKLRWSWKIIGSRHSKVQKPILLFPGNVDPCHKWKVKRTFLKPWAIIGHRWLLGQFVYKWKNIKRNPRSSWIRVGLNPRNTGKTKRLSNRLSNNDYIELTGFGMCSTICKC